jgi:phosphatidylglycerol---prolipoprotein diacylglyceryl transferase
MLPYLRVPDLLVLPARAFYDAWPSYDFVVHPFGLMVVFGLGLWTVLTISECQRRQLSTVDALSFLLFLAAFGFVGSHVIELVCYHPDRIRREPMALLRIWGGQSSFGGFLGAAVGAWAWRAYSKLSVTPYAEAVASALPSAWFFERLGCAMVHDHPGPLSSAWWAVAYPGGARLDMGLLEAVFVLPLAVAFLWLRRTPRQGRYFLGRLCTYYAPLRFTLDFWRAKDLVGSDVRYFQMTPAQWGSVALLMVGIVFLAEGARAAEPPSS